MLVDLHWRTWERPKAWKSSGGSRAGWAEAGKCEVGLGAALSTGGRGVHNMRKGQGFIMVTMSLNPCSCSFPVWNSPALDVSHSPTHTPFTGGSGGTVFAVSVLPVSGLALLQLLSGWIEGVHLLLPFPTPPQPWDCDFLREQAYVLLICGALCGSSNT